MEREKLYRCVAALALLVSLPAVAGDFTDLVKENATTPSVIISVPGSQPDNGYAIDIMTPKDLATALGLPESSTLLENDAFKVVEDQGNDALPITDFDGRNVLYNLMKGRAFYMSLAEKTGIRSTAFARKITVRVRVTHAPNPFTHFSKVPHVNDSGYMPFGDGHPELWFFVRNSGFRGFSLYDFVTNEALAAISRTWWAAGAGAAEEAYKDYDGGMDPAKLPNVIWHEAFHYSTDTPDLIKMVWAGFPPAEDYANYFASSFYGMPKLADLGAYSGHLYKRDYRKIHDLKQFQPLSYNSKALVPSILWKVREIIGQEAADQIAWSSIPLLRGSVSEVDLESALTNAVKASKLLSIDQKAQVVAEIQKRDPGFKILDQIFGNQPLPPQPAPAPVELAADLSDEDFAEAGAEYTDALAARPAELTQMGVVLTPEESAQFDAKVRELKQEPAKTGFKNRVLGALRTIGVKAGEYVGYAGQALQAAETVPAVFGTDFLTGLILGKGRLTDATPGFKPGAAQDLVGVAGGVPATYYANVGLTALARGYNGRLNAFGLGASEIDQLLCSRPEAQVLSTSDLSKLTTLQKYCSNLIKIGSAVRGGSAKAGAASGKAVRRFFSGKNPSEPGNAAPKPAPAPTNARDLEPLFIWGGGCWGR
jgi:hypothetical protein